MVRSARYEYCVYSSGARRESLVDMQRDPLERVNIAQDPAMLPVLIEHRQMLAQWQQRFGGVTWSWPEDKG